MNDEERNPDWTGGSDILNSFESSNKVVENNQIAYDQEVIAEKRQKVNAVVKEQADESATVAENETMILFQKRKSNPILWEHV